MRHLCSSTGCPHEGQFAVKLCVPHQRAGVDDPNPFAMILGARFCRRHVEEFEPGFVIDQPTPKGNGTFREAFSGTPQLTGGPVEWDSAYVVPLRTNSKEFEAMERAKRGN